MAEDPPFVGVAVKMADPAVARHRRRMIGWVSGAAAIGCFGLAVVLGTRPLDVVITRRFDVVMLLGLAGVVLLAVAAFVAPAPQFLRVIAVFMLGPGALLACGLVVALAFNVGGGYVEVESVEVPDANVRVVLLEHSGALGGSEVVLRGRLGPLPRERSLLNTSDCVVFLRAAGPRRVVVSVHAQSGCAVGTTSSSEYHVVVLDDGWSTDMSQVEP